MGIFFLKTTEEKVPSEKRKKHNAPKRRYLQTEGKARWTSFSVKLSKRSYLQKENKARWSSFSLKPPKRRYLQKKGKARWPSSSLKATQEKLPSPHGPLFGGLGGGGGLREARRTLQEPAAGGGSQGFVQRSKPHSRTRKVQAIWVWLQIKELKQLQVLVFWSLLLTRWHSGTCFEPRASREPLEGFNINHHQIEEQVSLVAWIGGLEGFHSNPKPGEYTCGGRGVPLQKGIFLSRRKGPPPILTRQKCGVMKQMGNYSSAEIFWQFKVGFKSTFGPQAGVESEKQEPAVEPTSALFFLLIPAAGSRVPCF